MTESGNVGKHPKQHDPISEIQSDRHGNHKRNEACGKLMRELPLGNNRDSHEGEYERQNNHDVDAIAPEFRELLLLVLRLHYSE